MKAIIQTPDGPRAVPDWARCHCCSRHTPMYVNPLPWALPEGDELWLCPNTHHQISTLWKLYLKLDGPPNGITEMKFTFFVKQLGRYAWQQQLRLNQDFSASEEHREAVEAARDEDDRLQKLFQKVRRAL